MNRKKLRDLLSSHADHLVEGRSLPPDQATEDDIAELAALLDVAEQVGLTLTPIKPKRKFETDLKRELLTTAHLRQAEGYVPPNPERDLMVIATIFGFVLGVLSIWLVFRLRR